MKCSIIIPTRLRAQLLSKTLDSLGNQTESDFEVIVVCDGEDEQTRLLAQTYEANFPLNWIFKSQKGGQAAARNTGATAATGDVLLFADDDATADPNWIAMHRRHYEAEDGDRPMIVCGRTIHVYARAPFSHTERFLRKEREESEAWFLSELSGNYPALTDNTDVYQYCGFNRSVRRSVFLRCGGYDRRMPPCEDDELAFRLHAHGVESVVELRAILYHHETKDLVEHCGWYWATAGRLHVYRMVAKGQRGAQFPELSHLRTLNPAKRVKQHLSWSYPQPMRTVTRLCRKVTDTFGSQRSFRLWKTLEMSTKYWPAVKAQGVDLGTLRKLVGPPLLVLALHGIITPLDSHERLYHLSPSRFRQLLELLRVLNIRCVPPAQGLSAPKPHECVLTFDDGYEELYYALLPKLDRYALKPVVFLVTDQLGGFNVWDYPLGVRPRKLLSIEQVREMQRYGIEFGSHTCTHPWLPSLPGKELQREVGESKLKLENLLGAEVKCFAYPYGGANSRVRAAVAKAGYKWAFSICPGLSLWNDPLWIRRVELSEADSRISILLKAFTGRSALQNSLPVLRRIVRLGETILPPAVSEKLKRTGRKLVIPPVLPNDFGPGSIQR